MKKVLTEDKAKALMKYLNFLSDMATGTVWTEYHWREANEVRIMLEDEPELQKKPFRVKASRWDGDTEILKVIVCKNYEEALNMYTKFLSRGPWVRIGIFCNDQLVLGNK